MPRAYRVPGGLALALIVSLVAWPGRAQPVAAGSGEAAPAAAGLPATTAPEPAAAAAAAVVPPRRPTGPAPAPCSSPADTLAVLADNLLEEDWAPELAAGCFARGGVFRSTAEGAALAEKLARVLEARGLELRPDLAPDEADHLDARRRNRYVPFPRQLSALRLERQGKRWLVPEDSLAQIPALYRQAYPFSLDELAPRLPTWLRLGALGIEAWQLLGLLVLVLLALALQQVVVRLLGTYLRRLLGRLNVAWGDHALHLASRPLGAVMLATVLMIGFPLLHFGGRANRITGTGLRVLALFSLLWLTFRLADAVADLFAERAARTESLLDDQLVPMLRKGCKLLLSIIAGLLVLQNLHIDVGSLLAGLGLGGLAFALAAKETLANLFGSLMIFVDRPFQIGDWIKVGSDQEGIVEEVGFRTTRIRTFYDSVIAVPNARIADSAIDNLGQRRRRRYTCTLGLTYDTPPEKVQAFCEGVRAILRGLPSVWPEEQHVAFTDFGPHALGILLHCFFDVPSRVEELQARTYLNLELLRLSEHLGVEFAFPSQTLYLHPTQPAVAREQDAPADLATLAEVIRGFGPGGAFARRAGVEFGVTFPAAPSPLAQPEAAPAPAATLPGAAATPPAATPSAGAAAVRALPAGTEQLSS